MIIRREEALLGPGTAALLAAGLGLSVLKDSIPTAPTSLRAVPSWAAQAGIEVVAVTALLWIGIASAAVLALLLLAAVALPAGRGPEAQGHRLRPSRPRLRHVAGIALTACAGASPPAMAQPSTAPPTTTELPESAQRAWMVPLPSGDSSPDESPDEAADPPVTTTRGAGVGTVRMEQVTDPPAPGGPPVGVAPPAQPVHSPGLSDPQAAEDLPSTARSGGDTQWVVADGDHLWGIAEETLADRSEDEPDLYEIVDYWQHLIEANRNRLVDPANPDLIYPGQVLLLPGGTSG